MLHCFDAEHFLNENKKKHHYKRCVVYGDKFYFEKGELLPKTYTAKIDV